LPSIINDDVFHKKPLEGNSIAKETHFSKDIHANEQTESAYTLQKRLLNEIFQLDAWWGSSKRRSPWKWLRWLHNRRRGGFF
jgi:hypothetical protein